MAGPDVTDFTSMVSQTLGISPLSLIISFPLGFVILYSILSKRKEWNKIGELGKTIFSFFIGYSIFTITRFFVWFLLMPFSAITYQPELSLQTDNITNSLLAIFFIFYLAGFIQSKPKESKIIDTVFKIYFLSTVTIGLALIVMFISVYFSALSFISNFVLVYVFLSIIFSGFGTYLIFLFLKKKQIRKVTKFSFVGKRELLVFIVIFIVSIAVLNYLLPHVVYYDVIEKEILIDGRQGLYNQQFWTTYRNIEIPIKIENSGYMGWIPIDYRDIIINFSEPYFIMNISSHASSIYENSFPNEYITKATSLKNATIDESFGKFILFFDRYTFLNIDELSNITLNGYKSVNLSKDSYSVKYSGPEINENDVLLKILIENKMSNDIEFRNMEIFYSGNQFSSCSLNTVLGEFDNITNTMVLRIGSCSPNSCELYSYFDNAPHAYIVMESNNIIARNIKLTPYSRMNITINLNCTK